MQNVTLGPSAAMACDLCAYAVQNVTLEPADAPSVTKCTFVPPSMRS